MPTSERIVPFHVHGRGHGSGPASVSERRYVTPVARTYHDPFLGGTRRSGVLRAELHCHSSLSYDGRDPVDMLLGQAAAVGLDALAVTDHDEIEASLAAAEQAADYDLVGIPGMEVTSEAGHVLALGVEELVPPGLSFVETLDRIHAQDGIAVVPHPFQR